MAIGTIGYLARYLPIGPVDILAYAYDDQLTYLRILYFLLVVLVAPTTLTSCSTSPGNRFARLDVYIYIYIYIQGHGCTNRTYHTYQVCQNHQAKSILFYSLMA